MKTGKVEVVLQSDVAECGMACVCMIAGWFGAHIPLSVLRENHRVSSRGSTLEGLIEVARSLGLVAYSARLEIDALRDLSGPLLLHWNLNHFVVMERAFKHGLQIVDPAVGRRTLPWDVVNARFTGVAVEFDTAPGFKPCRVTSAFRPRDLFPRFDAHKSTILHLLIIAALLESFVIAAPLFIQLIVDRGLTSLGNSLILSLAAGFSLVLLMQAMLSWARAISVAKLGAHLGTQLTAKLFSSLLRQPSAFFETRRFGDISARFSSADVVTNTLKRGFVEGVIDSVLAITTLSLMIMYSGTATLVTLVGVSLYAVIKYRATRQIHDINSEVLTYFARLQSHFAETVRGINSVKAFGIESRRETQFTEALHERASAELEIERLMAGGRTAVLLIFGLEQIVVIAIFASIVQASIASLGMLFAFLAFRGQFVTRSTNLIDRSSDFVLLGQHLSRMAEISVGAATSLSRDAPISAPLAVDLRNVSYKYGEFEESVVKPLCLQVPAGKQVAITGPSGTGKSTLLKIAAGLLSPTTGEALIFGVPAAEIRKSSEAFAIVLQDDYLFMGTISDNICLFDPDPDIEHVRHCAQVANIHDEIQLMPMKYRTAIGDLGSSLSGGQRQRMLLARALYKRPRLLILDEATSHLDMENERKIVVALKNSGITILMAAHREETISQCDLVYRLRNGSIEGNGKAREADVA